MPKRQDILTAVHRWYNHHCVYSERQSLSDKTDRSHEHQNGTIFKNRDWRILACAIGPYMLTFTLVCGRTVTIWHNVAQCVRDLLTLFLDLTKLDTIWNNECNQQCNTQIAKFRWFNHTSPGFLLFNLWIWPETGDVKMSVLTMLNPVASMCFLWPWLLFSQQMVVQLGIMAKYCMLLYQNRTL